MQQFGRGAFGNRFPAILALVYAGNETSASGGEVEEAVGPFGVEHDPRKLLRQVALHLEVCDGRIGAVIASPVSDAEHPPDAALRPVTPEGKRRLVTVAATRPLHDHARAFAGPFELYHAVHAPHLHQVRPECCLFQQVEWS